MIQRFKFLQLKQLSDRKQLHWHLRQHTHHNQLPKSDALPLQVLGDEDLAGPVEFRILSSFD